MKNAGIAALLICLSCALALVSGCDGKKPALKIGDPLPPAALTPISGAEGDVAALVRGRLGVILFWAEGCKYCERGMPDIEALYERQKDKGFMFVAVQIGGASGATEDLKKRFGLTFPMLHDPKSAIIKPYGIAGVPTMFIVGRDGRVAEKILGGLEARELEGLASRHL